jgi:hypothetical protein
MTTTTNEISIAQTVELLNNNATDFDENFIKYLNVIITDKIKEITTQKKNNVNQMFFQNFIKLLNEKQFNEAKELLQTKNKIYKTFRYDLEYLFDDFITAKDYKVVEWILKNLTEYFDKDYFEHKFVRICERQNLEVANIFNAFDPIKYQFNIKTTEKITEVISNGKTYSNIDDIVLYDSENDC